MHTLQSCLIHWWADSLCHLQKHLVLLYNRIHRKNNEQFHEQAHYVSLNYISLLPCIHIYHKDADFFCDLFFCGCKESGMTGKLFALVCTMAFPI